MVSLLTNQANLEPEWLIHELFAAQILEEHTLNKALSAFRCTNLDQSSGKEFARHLVDNQLLTEYQTAVLLSGHGQRLNLGPYIIRENHHAGSSGHIFRAIRRTDGSLSSVARLPMRNLWSVYEAKQYLATIAELPPHPTVVPLLDLDTANGYHYLAWPEVQGESFRTLVERAGSLPPAHAAKFMLDVAEGLIIWHNASLFHGLLSPNNLILGPDRRPRILDLGLGLVLLNQLHTPDSMVDTLNRSRLIVTTLDCMAPELIQQQVAPNEKSDIFSFGCVLFYLVTGSLPFPASNIREQCQIQLSGKAVSPRQLNSSLSPRLANFIQVLLNPDPTLRPNSFQEIRDELAAIVDDKDSVLTNTVTTAMTKTHPPLAKAEDTPSAGSLNDISFNLPNATGDAQASFELAVSGMLPLPGLEEVESLDEALSRANQLAAEQREIQEQEDRRQLRGALIQKRPATSSLPELDSIPAPVSWVANNRRELEEMTGSKTLPAVPPPSESFWTRAVRALRFWGPPRDLIQVSLFGPNTVTPGQPARLTVYVHAPDDFKNVSTLARALHDQMELLVVGNPDRLIQRGSEFGLHLSLANGGVAKSVHRFTWEAKPRSYTFEVLVPWESPVGRSPAVLSLGTNNLLAGRIPFAITIRARAGI